MTLLLDDMLRNVSLNHGKDYMEMSRFPDFKCELICDKELTDNGPNVTCCVRLGKMIVDFYMCAWVCVF